MITLKQIAALHMDKWSGGNQTNDTQMYYRSTILKIRAILNQILKVEMVNNKNNGDNSGLGQYIASYDLTVTVANGVASAELPDFYITMPSNGGVYRVFPKNRRQGGFDFVRTNNPGVSAHSEAGNYPGYKYYWTEGKKILFRGAYQEPDEDMNVTAQVFVAAPDTVGESDPLPISPDHVVLVLQELDKMAQPQVPADKLNNNNPNAIPVNQ